MAPLAAFAAAGLLAGGLGLLASGPAAGPASAVAGTRTLATPSCPKIIAPSTPPARAGQPAPPGSGLVLPAAARGGIGSRTDRIAFIAGPASPPHFRCDPPPADHGVIVPEPTVPAPAPGRGARRPKVAEPDRRQPHRRDTRRAARQPRPNAPATTATAAAAPLPARAGGYGGGVFPRDGSGLGATYGRSLVYSGLFGLALAVAGVAMVGRRRRAW
jgi:hypothetical protein